jgi:hypothetical protein
MTAPPFEQAVRRALLASPSTWATSRLLAQQLGAPTRQIREALHYLRDADKVVSRYTPALTRSWVEWRWANPVTAQRVNPPTPVISRARLIDRTAC